ncbi:GFA family protein [Novosphingobium sp.]|uniref:GFA family protein n=1 Tax=Novosphingobium sp. TaxID=1874826 RepID=UPI0026127555|nr:GFA family protein [Novosphingobium sp.]
MELSGGCQCGAVRYAVKGEAQHSSLCHCADCRKSAGAPMVGWAAYADADFEVTQGEPVVFNSSGSAMRAFCGTCGTGLFYRNAEFLPGLVDIQTATLDDPEALPPQLHVQVAERIGWMESAHELPAFERYPG